MYGHVKRETRDFFDSRDVAIDPVNELKWFDFDSGEMEIGTGGTKLVGTFNGIAQGAGESQRTGLRIIIVKIEIRLYAFIPGDQITTGGEEALRLITHLDTQANGAHATENSIMGSGADFRSFQLPDNMGRYYFIWDEVYDLNCYAGTNDGANSSFSRGRNIVLSTECRIPIDFKVGETSGAFTNITKNNLGILAYSKNGKIQLQARSRLWFLD